MCTTYAAPIPSSRLSLGTLFLEIPWSKHWHQLDQIITRQRLLNNVLISHLCTSADHSLVGFRVIFKPKGTRGKDLNRARPHARRNCNPFTGTLCGYLVTEPPQVDAKQTWHLRHTFHAASFSAFVKEQGKTHAGFMPTPGSSPLSLTKEAQL